APACDRPRVRAAPGPGRECGSADADDDPGAGSTGPAAACAWPDRRCRRKPRYRRRCPLAQSLLFSSEKRRDCFCSITTRHQHTPSADYHEAAVILLQHIAGNRHSLRKSELKVADHVLNHAAQVMHSSMADLAREVGVSEPTIVRFCRAIGCSGFQDLKLKLAQSLAAGASFGQFSISEDDSIAELSHKIFDTTLATLMDVRESLDAEAMEQAILAMAEARRVEFYGFGASGAVASDAQHKFFRLQVSTAAYSDPHMQAMSAVTLGP